MKKKITPTIANLLAAKVLEKLEQSYVAKDKKCEEQLKKDPLYIKYMKVQETEKALEKARNELKQKLNKKYDTKDVCLELYYSKPRIKANRNFPSQEVIKNDILLDDFYGSATSVDEVVDSVFNKYKNQ